MHNLKRIRKHLGLSQQAMADMLGCTQGNVAQREQGQLLSSELARKLIAAAKEKGVTLTFDHVYCEDIELPALPDSMNQQAA